MLIVGGCKPDYKQPAPVITDSRPASSTQKMADHGFGRTDDNVFGVFTQRPFDSSRFSNVTQRSRRAVCIDVIDLIRIDLGIVDRIDHTSAGRHFRLPEEPSYGLRQRSYRNRRFQRRSWRHGPWRVHILPEPVRRNLHPEQTIPVFIPRS